MPLLTILFGVALMMLGVAFFFGTGSTSVTALIPTFFGLPLLICGALAMKDKFRMHAMHGAAALGALGTLGAAYRGVPAFWKLLLENPGVVATNSMMVICAVYVGISVRSFIEARKKRKAEQQ